MKVALLLGGCVGNASGDLSVNVNTSACSATISERFLSFCMDPFTLTVPGRWQEELDTFWYSDVMRAFAKPFAPAYLRYGGTPQDFAAYDFGGRVYDIQETDPPGDRVLINASVVNALLDFTEATGWEAIFGANLGTHRTEGGAWDPAGFRALLEYVKPKRLAGWELGNEPDLFNKHHPGNRVSVEASVRDFATFRQVLSDAGQSSALVIGPDVTRNNATFMGLWASGVGGQADVATYHHYYGPGSSDPHGLGPKDFHDPTTLDLFLNSALEMEDAVGNWRKNDSSRKLWIGETSSTYDGGSANTSSSFVAGFMWLDKLGLAANLGVSVVLRETFAHGDYSVIGRDNLPNPDFYTSLLWRRLVGSRVLPVEGVLEGGRIIRAYAFCSRLHVGGVVIAWLNTGGERAELGHSLSGRQLSYVLTSYPGVLTSRDIFLNGEALAVDAKTGELLVKLSPSELPAESKVSLPPTSYGFLELPDAEAPACAAGEAVLV